MTAPSIRSKKGILILTVTILVSGLGFLMNSAVTIALPQIQEAFDSGISEVQWIANTYILALGSLILLSGVLGDIFGLKKVFTLGIGLFTLGTLLCAAAWNAGSLIAFRGVKGIGAALMIPGSLAVLNRTFAKSDRGKAIGLWAGVSGAIAALSPFFGGILAEISWRLVFAAAVPLGAAASILALRFLPKLPGEKKPLIGISIISVNQNFRNIAGSEPKIRKINRPLCFFLEICQLALICINGRLHFCNFIIRRTYCPYRGVREREISLIV